MKKKMVDSIDLAATELEDELFGSDDEEDEDNNDLERLFEREALQAEYNDHQRQDSAQHQAATEKEKTNNEGEKGQEKENNEEDGVSAEVKKKIAALAKRRIVKNPQPKMDSERLLGSRGLGALQQLMLKAPFRGGNHLTADLKVLLRVIQYWAHRLYPRMAFVDFVERAERLGSKREVKTYLTKMRCGLPTSDGQFSSKSIVDGDHGDDDHDDDGDVDGEQVEEMIKVDSESTSLADVDLDEMFKEAFAGQPGFNQNYNGRIPDDDELDDLLSMERELNEEDDEQFLTTSVKRKASNSLVHDDHHDDGGGGDDEEVGKVIPAKRRRVFSESDSD